ncbi:hypothetical protein LTR95_001091 [Oleoguttula sp. CCFEE 5521]
MSKDETYVRNVTEIPDEKDAKYGWVVTGNDLCNWLWRAKFFTQHAEKDSAKIKHCIADVNGMFMHGPMSTPNCERGDFSVKCQSDHRISRCWNLDDNGKLKMQQPKKYDWGKNSIHGNADGGVKCYNCINARVHDPLWPQQAAVQCHYAHGLTMDQMKQHNRIYETTILPDPCPGAAGYKPTPAPKSRDGAWEDPI